MEFNISQTWNGDSVEHNPVILKLSPNSQTDFKVTVEAPYFGDPPAPHGPSCEPFPELWDYEVVELFLMNKHHRYVEVELCPHGQHLVLLLDGRRNMVQDQLPIVYTATVTGDRWSGEALVPFEYLPPQVDQMNAFAIHGSGTHRVYEAYSPATKTFNEPDFHRLEFFKSIDLSFLTSYKPVHASLIWNKIVNK